MPDEEESQPAADVPDVEESQPAAEVSDEGGQDGDVEVAETPAPTSQSDDDDFVDPESPARAEAGRAPRGAPPA